MAITLRLVKGTTLTYSEADINFSSLIYSATQSGSSIAFHTTGSTLIGVLPTATLINVGLGSNVTATGAFSHAEGYYTIASGAFSHAEGFESQAKGVGSHAEGLGTITSGSYQHAQGQYNIPSLAQSAFIVGNGTSDGSRSNLLFASGSQVQITGSLRVNGSTTIRENIFTGTNPPGGTSGGYFNIINYPSAIASGFNFLGRDDSDSDGFGTVSIDANPEDGISIYGSTYNNTEISQIKVIKNIITIATPTFYLTSVTASISSSNSFKINSPLVEITGSLTVGSGSSILAPTFGVKPNLSIGMPTGSTGAVLDLRNTSGSISPGDMLGIIQFSGKADNPPSGYASSQIRATVSQAPNSGNPGGGILSFWTGQANTGASPEERMRITQIGNVLLGTTSGTTAKLQVEATGTTHALVANAITGSGIYVSSQTGSGANIGSQNGIGLEVSSYSGTIARFRSNTGYENMKLFNNGNLLLNTLATSGANQSDTGYRLYVGGTTNISGNTTITGSVTQGAAGNIASGIYSHVEGGNTIATGNYSHAEGLYTSASGGSSHTEGFSTIASGSYSHAEGSTTLAQGDNSHAEGLFTTASGISSHAEGANTVAKGVGSHAEGLGTIASGSYSHAEGTLTIASGDYSHAEGYATTASFFGSHTEGSGTVTTHYYAHAEGLSTLASGQFAHAEGQLTIALGQGSHAEGSLTVASGIWAHAEGANTTASGDYSHAEGNNAKALREGSHAEGYYTVASGSHQHVQGQFNISSSLPSAFIIGNGSSDASRSNLIFAHDAIVEITGSLMLNDILVLAPRTTTPTPSAGMVIVSGSGVDQHIYCYLNSTWKQLD